jgi:hypothetical protein
LATRNFSLGLGFRVPTKNSLVGDTICSMRAWASAITQHCVGMAKTLASGCRTLRCHAIIAGTVAGRPRPVAGGVRVAHGWSGLDDGVGTCMMGGQDRQSGRQRATTHAHLSLTRRGFCISNLPLTAREVASKPTVFPRACTHRSRLVVRYVP